MYHPYSSSFQSLVIFSAACSLHYTVPPVTAVPLPWRRYACFTIFWPRKTACLGSMPSISMVPALFLPLALDLPVLIPTQQSAVNTTGFGCTLGSLGNRQTATRQGATVSKMTALTIFHALDNKLLCDQAMICCEFVKTGKPSQFALRRALYIQRNDADQPLTPLTHSNASIT